MSKIPLYLKIKENQQAEGVLLFEVVSDKSITYNDKNYDFTKIISNDDYSDLIEEPATDSSCFIFMGPTGAGKTTTLKKVVYNKIKSLQDLKLVKFLTAFEVSGNRYIIDLLERKANNRKEIQNAISIEAKLKKEKLNQDNAGSIISAVFSRRNTRKTTYNDESSRSCLIITFFHNNKRVTYIDLMGNEKFDKSTSNSNIFANSSISAITQLLSKRVINGRSSNFITNLIFRKDASQHKNINIILHLDQYGDSSLVKSTLVNIADLLKNFEFDDSFTHKKNHVSYLPNYAKPTVASLSPVRLGLRPSNRINSSPSKVKPISSISRQRKAPKSPVRQMGLKSPLRSTYLRSSPIKFQPMDEERIEVKNKEDLIHDFHGIQVAGLKKAIEDLEYENSQLKKEHEEILEFFNKNSSDVNTDLTICKDNEEDIEVAAMKAELEDLRKMNYETETLEKQKKFLIDRVDEFKIDFHKFKEEHGSFKDKVDNLKETIVELEKTTSLLQEANTTKDEKIDKLTSDNDEIMKKNSELETIIEESSAKMESLKDELSKIVTSNKELLENHETLKMKYQELVDFQKENELNKESISEFSQKLEEKDSLIIRLKENISAKEDAISKAANEVKDIQRQLDELNTDADIKSEQVYKLESEIQEKDTLISTIRLEIETLKSTLTEGNELFEEKEIELKNADKKIASLEDEVKKLEVGNSKLSSSLEEQDQRFSEVSNTVSELKHEISVMESKNSDLQLQIDEKNSRINDATESNKELKQQIEELEFGNKDLKGSLSSLKDDFEKMETKLSKKLEKKEKKQNNESTELQNKNTTLLNTIAGLEEDIKNKESEWSARLQEINTERTEEISRLESNSKALEDKLNNVHLEMELMEKEWSKKLEQLECSKNETINDLQTQLSNNIQVESVQNIESLDTMDFFNDQMSFPKFNPSNIFEDINTNMIDLPSEPAESVDDSLKENTPMEAAPKEKSPSKSPSKKKKALMPSNKSEKSENYKDKINFMSKDKKLKRKASTHKLKHKHHKSNPTKTQAV